MKSRNTHVAAVSVCAVLIALQPYVRTAQTDLQPTKEFAQELKQSGLAFDASVFAGFTAVRVLPNPHFTYSFAVRHVTLPFEVRFATRELGPSGQVKPDLLPFAWASIANMARQERSEPVMVFPEEFDPGSVREEFNADWGVTSRFAPKPTFAKYDNGLAVVIYRAATDSFGYMIFLFDGDAALIKQTLLRVFHAIRFK
jgi:hypothetical protein